MADSIPLSGAVDRTPKEKHARLWLEVMHEWIVTTDHKKIGMMYIAAALMFLVIGGVEALLIRIQLARPESTFVSPEQYNQLFTLHGTTMIFFVAMPILLGFGNYLVPLMIGARDMAFPRLNAFSFWIFLFGASLLYFSFLGGKGLFGGAGIPDQGWFAYAPLTSVAFSKSHAADYWALGIFISGIGSIGTALNTVATTLCLRCKGMKLNRMPLFVWLMLVTSVLILGAIPPLGAAQLMLLVDRFLGGHFFDTQAGGSAVLWAHFFWIFGHPEVYILVLPAFGFVNEIIPVFSRKAIFGYPAMVAASVGIGFISFTVWAHHMFTVGMGAAANTAFVLSTMIIAIPTGIKIFNWLATMWGGKIYFTVPMLFCTAFLFQFTLAGLTGVMLAVAPFDWQLHNSYFVVAHFHYVIVGGILFALFAAFYYWFPKMTGRMMSETLGKWNFWLFVLGFHMTFDTMHIPGLLGMPREIYTYEPGHHWAIWNMIITIGAFIQAIAILIFVYNLVRSHFVGELADNDPWDAWTLEWATTSPPPSYNFADEPKVRSRRPLWDLKHPEDPDWKYEVETENQLAANK
ncbi:MAG TPA: cytochrome c oxidase subunit I [Acidobacteriaceae bacterium]|nr:cytochrome c oxidase subunit I [Terriglobia bacterium]HVC90169.1 cytochrome c oxidase subunit I [Acidobacteriaceae bacterium]